MGRRYFLLRAAAGLGVVLISFIAAPAKATESKTFGFVVRDWFTAAYNSRFNDECPEGLAISNDELWWRSLPKDERAQLTNNGQRPKLDRYPTAMRRGPDGENVCLNPTVVTDPPMRVVEGKYSYGRNLDGNTDGRAMPKTCAHDNFIHLDGTPGIDNQMYRLVGCVLGWRKGGLTEMISHERRRQNGLGMILIEITGVEDARNDDDVTVAFYRSVDQYVQGGNGRPLPHSSYNIDMAGDRPRYGDTLKGRITDGELTTDRGDVSLPFYANYTFMHPVIKDMDLRLEIGADGASAQGLITGYYDMEAFLHYIGGMQGHTSSAADCPAMVKAAYELADGYPDSDTGQCTHLSSAFEISAIAAFIIHPDVRAYGETSGNVEQMRWSAAVEPLPLPPGFKTFKTERGQLLTDAQTMTLYVSSADPPGASACNDACVRTWLPVEAWWGARSAPDDWSLIDRTDGSKLWAYKGQPLYRYTGDLQPEDFTGDGVDTFSAVVLEPPPPVPSWVTVQYSDAGPLLADANGMTLYAYDLPEDRAFSTPFDRGTSRDMATPHMWTPVYADDAAAPTGHWAIVLLDDGQRQWTYKGMKISVYKADTEPGDLNGQRGTDRYWRTIMKSGKDMAGAGR